MINYKKTNQYWNRYSKKHCVFPKTTTRADVFITQFIFFYYIINAWNHKAIKRNVVK